MTVREVSLLRTRPTTRRPRKLHSTRSPRLKSRAIRLLLGREPTGSTPWTDAAPPCRELAPTVVRFEPFRFACAALRVDSWPVSGVPVYRGHFGARQAERLLWRAGFGPKPGEARHLAKKGLKRAVHSLTRPPSVKLHGPAPTDGDVNPIAPHDAYRPD